MAMSSNIHINSNKKGSVEFGRLEKCTVNTMDIKDAEGNQVCVFMTVEQLKRMRLELDKYLDQYGHLVEEVEVEGKEDDTCPF